MTNPDRVRKATSADVNRELDRRTSEDLRQCEGAGEAAITARIAALDRQWDIERVLETNAAAIGLSGLVLGVAVDRRWLALPAVVLGFLMQHAIQGWCPPVPVFRRLGVRTRREIDEEKYALKAMRGDFAAVGGSESAAAAMSSAKA